MRPRQIIRYCRELGWNDPPDLVPTGPAEQQPATQQPATQRPATQPSVRLPQASQPPTTQPAAAAAETTGAAAIPPCTSLTELARNVEGCERCRLARTRKRIVFGEGAEDASLLFIGEAPGSEEDRSGRPFVGQAGQLLDAMIFALGLERRQVYIANVLKCRPPENRDPEQNEVDACADLLAQQIDLIKPAVIVALGKPATARLTGVNRPISSLRGRWASYRGIPVMPTFHPAYLLRNSGEKRQVWDDLQKVHAKLLAD